MLKVVKFYCYLLIGFGSNLLRLYALILSGGSGNLTLLTVPTLFVCVENLCNGHKFKRDFEFG